MVLGVGYDLPTYMYTTYSAYLEEGLSGYTEEESQARRGVVPPETFL